MAGRTSTPHFTGDDGGTKIKIRKPNVNTARAIRDAILRDYFGYTENDIKELDAQMPGKFFICVEGGDGNQEMTPEQVSGWLPDSGGMISVTLNSYWLKNLSAFREGRVMIVLNQSVGAISDSAIRVEVLKDLEKIIYLSGNDRLTAVRNLIMKGSANGSVTDALAYLTAQDGYADNPFLLIVRAEIDTLNYTTKSGPGYDTLIQPLLAKAIKKASENFNFNVVKYTSSAISREEAAYINREAAWMFANIGKDKDFQERDWLARFYAMTEKERAGLQEGDTIYLAAPGVNAMSTPRPQTEAEQKLATLKSERVEDLRRQNELDVGRSVNETNDPRSVDRTEILPKITTTTEVKGSTFPYQERKDAFPRGQNHRNPPPGKIATTMEGARANPTAIRRGNYGGGLFDLAGKWGNAITFRVRIEIVTRYIAERERLENKIAAERVVVVPPKPATIEKILTDFRRYGRTTANPFEKEEILKLILKLEQLRERSYAMWK